MMKSVQGNLHAFLRFEAPVSSHDKWLMSKKIKPGVIAYFFKYLIFKLLNSL